ncbi:MULTISPECIES: hypothetical protein [unclassified Streptomyces]|nr:MULTISPECIES: hypothetical protein [unclassified Streptomyces]MBT2430130.1 hypothetical protein [Streptomyces sp. ISL-112]MBT2465904.1 hypothetical protein [Streptomyces sp. ISL-63]
MPRNRALQMGGSTGEAIGEFPVGRGSGCENRFFGSRGSETAAARADP